MNMEAASFSQKSVFAGLHGVMSQTVASLVFDIVRWAGGRSIRLALDRKAIHTKLWSGNEKEKNYFGKLDVE